MNSLLASPRASFIAGALLALLLLAVWFGVAAPLWSDLLALAVRSVHAASSIVWVGLIVFVNFIQLKAIAGADEARAKLIGRSIGGPVAWWFRMASHLTVLSGIGLLLGLGYLAPSLIHGSAIFPLGPRVIVLWLSALGGLTMWIFVHMVIWPSLQVASGARPADADARDRARLRVRNFARLNLILSIPVVVGMVAAGHM